jgi:hypothetical protein
MSRRQRFRMAEAAAYRSGPFGVLLSRSAERFNKLPVFIFQWFCSSFGAFGASCS